MTENNQPIRS